MKQVAKLKEKASQIAAQGEMSEMQKIRAIQQLYKKAGKNQKQQTVYIVRKKFQSGAKGPRTRKGNKVKIVDRRLKNILFSFTHISLTTTPFP